MSFTFRHLFQSMNFDMIQVKIVPIKKLKAHEKVNRKNLIKVRSQILNSGYAKNPIMVAAKYYVILDGHHRTRALLDFALRQSCVAAESLAEDSAVVLRCGRVSRRGLYCLIYDIISSCPSAAIYLFLTKYTF
jgi:hypothetical protein